MILDRLILGFFALALVGCTTFSKEQCERFSWSEKGAEAANNGNTSNEAYRYFERECGATHQIQPVRSQWDEGYNQGLVQFCTPERALVFGRTGGVYKNTCTNKDEEKFLSRYQLGRIEHSGEEIKKLTRKIDDLERELKNKDDKIRDLEDEIRRKE